MTIQQQTKLIKKEYIESIDNIYDSLEDKKLKNALIILLDAQRGNPLLSTKETSKFTSITQYTSHLYLQALIKDIKTSFKELEKAIDVIVNNKEAIEILEEDPVLFGEEIEYTFNNDTVSISSKKLLEAEDFFKNGFTIKRDNLRDKTLTLIDGEKFDLYELEQYTSDLATLIRTQK